MRAWQANAKFGFNITSKTYIKEKKGGETGIQPMPTHRQYDVFAI